MDENNYCTECGMITNTGEYHPYAACVLFRAIGSGYEVRNQLQYIRNSAIADAKKVCVEAVRIELTRIEKAKADRPRKTPHDILDAGIVKRCIKHIEEAEIK